MKIKEYIKKYPYLVVPDTFWKEDESNLSLMVGGCGPGKGFGDKIIPDKLFGLDIKPCCIIHDYQCFFIKTKEEEDLVDLLFLFNMIKHIDNQPGNKLSKFFRRRWAFKYYLAVSIIDILKWKEMEE